ncbi:MAG: ABC transporter permease [Hyphomicrobiaceae bacterium]|nr:ABC transporter permease [Hyphomicrobiaceae bacterium]
MNSGQRGGRRFGSVAAFVVPRLLLLLAAACLGFLFAEVIGDPVGQMLPPDATLADRLAMRRTLGLDQPAPVRLLAFLGRLLAGDLGVSWRSAAPVASLIAEALPVTLDMALLGVAGALGIAVPLAVHLATRPEAASSKVLSAIVLTALALPVFVSGLLLMSVLAAWLGWLPAVGRGDTVSIGGWTTGLLTISGLASLVMPAATIACALAGQFTQILTSELENILRQPYIAAAHARGLPPSRVHYMHALANAWPPLIGALHVQFGNVLVFAIVTETVFERQGLGLLFLRAANDADMPVVAALVVLAALVFTVLGLIGDTVLYFASPRLREPAASDDNLEAR